MTDHALFNNEEIMIYWTGLSGEEREIGFFVVTEEITERLEREYKGEIEIYIYRANVAKPVQSFDEVVSSMRKTKYGKLFFRSK